MTITADLFEAFLKCPTKCYLRSRGEVGAGHAYADWLRTQNESWHRDRIKCKMATRRRWVNFLRGERTAVQARARPIDRKAAMLSTIEITPSHASRFFAYFAVLSLVMLPAAVAFARKKTSRWFLLSVGLLMLIGGALNWWGLLPTFSWNGYEPDWPPICVGAFLVMMLLAIFGNVRRRRRRQK
jgi:hypothetical protein